MRRLIQVRHITALAHNRLTRYATYQAPLVKNSTLIHIIYTYYHNINNDEHIREASLHTVPFSSLHNHLINPSMNHIILMPNEGLQSSWNPFTRIL